MSGTLLGEKELRALADAALAASTADETEVSLSARTNALTRYANAFIHQNVVSTEASVRVRAARGKRVALISTDRLDREGVEKAARDASELAALVPENPRFNGLVAPQPIPPAPSAYSERTAEATPLDRAKAVKRICDPAKAKGLGAAGYVQTTAGEIAIANSKGVWAYWPRTTSEAQVVAIGADGSAYADRASRDFGTLDVGGAADEAIAKAVAMQHPRDAEPGTYEVVLEQYAVMDIVSFLAQQLTGLAIEEGRSFVDGKMGERVTGPITLVDDPFDPDGNPLPFDYEGHPASRVTLIEQGVARAVVYDSQSAARAGARNTGHALPANPFMSVAPMHIRLDAGDKTREQLIRDTQRGLLVTRFHYTRWVHQLRTIVTGMTREGTFLIENGEIAGPVKNLRFTQSYADALGGTLGIGRDLRLITGFMGTSRRVPALHLSAFTFTGATRY
jgi:PmbA protein